MDNGRTDLAVLDRAQLEEAAGGDAELIRELAELYVMDGEEQLGTLRDASKARRLEEVHRVAHGLKGSSASIGATEAAAAFRVLEMLGRTGELIGLDDALAAAEGAFERARAALANL